MLGWAGSRIFQEGVLPPLGWLDKPLFVSGNHVLMATYVQQTTVATVHRRYIA